MKFNKEKTKKFQQGGKTPKEIMEEARRNQAIWQQQQEANISAAIARDAANTAARDAVYNSGIPAYQSPPVHIQDPRSLVLDKINPDRRTHTMGNSNLSEVVILGKGPRREQRPAPTTTTNTTTRELPPETEVVIPRIINEEDSTRVVTGQPQLEKELNSELANRGRDWSQEQAPNRDPGSIYANHRPKRIDWGWIRRKWNGLNQGSILYQQGGQLPLRSGLERFFRIEPRYTSVDSTSLTPTESVTDYIDNTLRGPKRVSRIRKPVDYGSGYLTSTRVIRNPWTDKSDTTYVTPSGDRFNQFEATRTPSLRSYPDKFGKYFKHQQGGTIVNEETGSTDQLYVDFAIRYLKAKGVSEDNMVDNEGGLKDEFLEEISTAINEVDSPDFWEQYQSNPDEVVQSYIESKMEPAQIEMARKGAKLKKLKKGGMKSKKCKCGCNLTMKKEAGGKIKEVCACGCKK